eukprot:11969810-Ditylum_brightwellii.AAC.1
MPRAGFCIVTLDDEGANIKTIFAEGFKDEHEHQEKLEKDLEGERKMSTKLTPDPFKQQTCAMDKVNVVESEGGAEDSIPNPKSNGGVKSSKASKPPKQKIHKSWC